MRYLAVIDRGRSSSRLVCLLGSRSLLAVLRAGAVLLLCCVSEGRNLVLFSRCLFQDKQTLDFSVCQLAVACFICGDSVSCSFVHLFV